MIEDVTDMVARVRAAIDGAYSPSDSSWDKCARAAIEAMREPTEAMWGGLARDMIFWDRYSKHNGTELYQHLKAIGTPIPDWLREEIPDTTTVPPKGTVAACIWRAMISAALNPNDAAP